MAISLREITDDIRAIASSGSNPDNFKIPDEQIFYWINQTRAMLINQSLLKKDDLNDTWLQQINCMALEPADESECCLAPSGCYVLKTVRKIPSTIDTWKPNWIVSVTTAFGDQIPKSNQFSNRYQKYNKYTGNKKYYYLKNDYIYVVNNEDLSIINVQALFEDPMELANFPTCEGGVCFSTDSPYPASANMSSQITDIIIKTKVMPFMQFPSDNINDGNNDSQTQPGRR
jgi:hypothetical protein